MTYTGPFPEDPSIQEFGVIDVNDIMEQKAAFGRHFRAFMEREETINAILENAGPDIDVGAIVKDITTNLIAPNLGWVHYNRTKENHDSPASHR